MQYARRSTVRECQILFSLAAITAVSLASVALHSFHPGQDRETFQVSPASLSPCPSAKLQRKRFLEK